jgi:16S rRNA (cytidine1402-2'-O)-methyltransferase
MAKGKIVLLPNLLHDEAQIEASLPAMHLLQISSSEYIIAESLKSARRLLKKIQFATPFESLLWQELNEHTEDQQIVEMMQPILNGKNAVLISDAGLPCIADPGSKLVFIAQQFDVEILPLVGPGSFYLALMASGLNGQRFRFWGYLKIDKQIKLQQFRTIESDILKYHESQIFIETPYRNTQLFNELIQNINPKIHLTLAYNLQSSGQKIITKSIESWKKTKIDIHKKPCIFILGMPFS